MHHFYLVKRHFTDYRLTQDLHEIFFLSNDIV